MLRNKSDTPRADAVRGGPLAGVKVVDMTSVLMGPFASQSLGDMGADVVKVEAPGGDLVRQIGPARHEGMGPVYLNANRNKRSVVLDLKNPEGLAALKRLLADADVLMYNVRPQAMARLGLAYEEVAALNPRIVYAGLFGFGQDGPYAARPAYDDLIQGASTLPHLIAQASGGIPRYVPTAMADRIVGLTGVSAILASLHARERTGRGDRVDIPMFETMVAFVLGDHLGRSDLSNPRWMKAGTPASCRRERRPYRTRDGYLCALVYTDKQWLGFLREIGREALMHEDERFANYANRSRHIDYVYGVLATIFQQRSTAEWLELLARADVPSMPMHSSAQCARRSAPRGHGLLQHRRASERRSDPVDAPARDLAALPAGAADDGTDAGPAHARGAGRPGLHRGPGRRHAGGRVPPNERRPHAPDR